MYFQLRVLRADVEIRYVRFGVPGGLDVTAPEIGNEGLVGWISAFRLVH
jgi:hypothetical protein